MSAIFYIISGFILFAVLRITDKIMHSGLVYNKVHPLVLRVFPVLEFVLWFLYLFWALSGIFSHWDYYNILMHSVIIAVIIILAWFIIKDFVAGIVLKAEMPFHIGQNISLPGIEGKLKKLGFRSLEIEKNDGQSTKVPYSKLTGEMITCQSKSESSKGYETTVSLKSSINDEKACELIKKKLMLLPWALPSKKPYIELLEDKDKSKKTYLVKYFAINNQHAVKISQNLKSFFDNNESKPANSRHKE